MAVDVTSHALSEFDVSALIGGRRERVFACEVEGRRVWIKRAITGKMLLGHRVQNLAAWLLRLELLRLTNDVAGGATLSREERVIRALAAKGARVPEVLARGEDYLVLSDLGPSLREQMRGAETPVQVKALALDAACALRRLHADGAWHGNPLVRNMAGEPERIGFLDFEEDPAAVMSVEACQARDVLLFLYSLAPFEKRVPGLMREVAGVVFEGRSEAVLAHLRMARRATAPVLVPLRLLRRGLGRDGRTALDVFATLDLVRRPFRPAVRWGVVGGVGSLLVLALYAVLAE